MAPVCTAQHDEAVLLVAEVVSLNLVLQNENEELYWDNFFLVYGYILVLTVL